LERVLILRGGNFQTKGILGLLNFSNQFREHIFSQGFKKELKEFISFLPKVLKLLNFQSLRRLEKFHSLPTPFLNFLLKGGW